MNSALRNWSLGVLSCLALAACWMIVAGPHSAQAKGKPGSGGGGQKNYSVCVVFDNLATDGIFSDDLPPSPIDSTPYCNNSSQGILAAVGNGFRLDTQKSTRKDSTRTLYFDFGDPNLNGHAVVDMRISNQYVTDESGNLTLAGHRLDMGNMKAGEVARAALSIWFEYADGQRQALTYADAEGYPDCPNSAPVRVTRGEGENINTWRIETVSPLDEFGGGDGCLWGNGAGGRSYFMPFGIDIVAMD